MHPESRSILPGFYPVATNSAFPTPGHAPAHLDCSLLCPPQMPACSTILSAQHSSRTANSWTPTDPVFPWKQICSQNYFNKELLPPVPRSLGSTLSSSSPHFPHTLPARPSIPSPIQGSRLALLSCMLTVAIAPHASVSSPEITFHIDATLSTSQI